MSAPAGRVARRGRTPPSEVTGVEQPVASRKLGAAGAASAVAFLVVALLVGLAIGPAAIGPRDILQSAVSHVPFLHLAAPLDRVNEAILWQIRAPRVALAALVGGMLAVAGASYQGVFRNPLADPYLLGIAAGAGLGATLAIAYGGGGFDRIVLPVAAFAGAAAAVGAAYVLGRSAAGSSDTTALVLAGVVVALFMTAVQTFAMQERSETLREVYAWILGGFGSAGWPAVAVAAPYVLLTSAVLLALRRTLDVMRLGDEEARALGIDVGRMRLLIIGAATLGTAAAVAVSGLIGFVGIIVPHAVRLLASPSYRVIVPVSLVAGAGFLVLADVLARTVLSPSEVPIGVVTAFFGGPFFALLLRSMRSQSR